jgi:hypothetical protein
MRMLIDRKYLCTPDGNPLAINQIVRHDHKECGDTKRRLYIKRTLKGYLYHCHNCAPVCSGLVSDTALLSASEIQQEIASANKGSVYDVDNSVPFDFPADFSKRLPSWWLGWLCRYGITLEEINLFEIGWSPLSGHLILPVFNEAGDIASWTERVSPESKVKGAKYLLRCKAHPDTDDHLAVLCDDSSDLVVVEDYISTIKCGRIVNALCLNGSHMPHYIYPELRAFERIFVWLDKDKEVYANTLVRRLNSMGHDAYLISTPHDPKEHSTLRMQELFNYAVKFSAKAG